LEGHHPDPDATKERRSGSDRRIGQDPVARRILLVESDSTLRHLYRLTLEAHGWVVEVAEDGHAALARAEVLPPDVLVIDTLLDLDRISMLERLRAHESTRDVAVIVLANSAEEPATPRERELGVIGRLVKNWFTRDRLSETIVGLLDRRTFPADRRQSSA